MYKVKKKLKGNKGVKPHVWSVLLTVSVQAKKIEETATVLLFSELEVFVLLSRLSAICGLFAFLQERKPLCYFSHANSNDATATLSQCPLCPLKRDRDGNERTLGTRLPGITV